MEVASPITRRPVSSSHRPANAAMVWLLPAPAGAISAVPAVVAVSIITTAAACSALRPVPVTASRARASVTSCGHGLPGGGEDLFFGVEVLQGGVPVFVRRPVDAAAVGGADTQGAVRR